MAIAWLAISRLLINRVSQWPSRQCFWRNRASTFAGAALFMTVDLNQAYWQMLLADNLQELFTFVTQKGLYVPM